MSGTLVAVISGERYEIPESWVMGFCTQHRCGVDAAVDFWHWQEQLERTGRWVDPPRSLAGVIA